MNRLAGYWRSCSQRVEGVRVAMVPVDPADRAAVRRITRLHLQLLSWGPMAELGERVLERFCYTTLVHDGLLQAAVLEVDGQPAGFIAFTDQSITFHRHALRAHPVSVAWHTSMSVLADPRRLQGLWRTARVIVSRRGEKATGTDPSAEVVAIGVLPAYRRPAFVRRTRLHVGQALLGYAAAYFLQHGMTRMRMVVDGDNRPALLFYHGLGGRLESFERGGVPSYQVWFEAARAQAGVT